MNDDELVILGEGQDLLELDAGRRRVDQLAARDERRRLGEPRRIPEGTDLPPRLIARPGAAVEAVEGWWLQEQRLHHARPSPLVTRRPSAPMRNVLSRQATRLPRKLTINTQKDNISRTGTSQSHDARSLSEPSPIRPIPSRQARA